VIVFLKLIVEEYHVTQLYTNYNNISLPLSVWLAANDGYDVKPADDVISATTLLKSTKSIVLSQAILKSGNQGLVDIADMVASRLGTATHTAVEVAWTKHYKIAMKNLGMANRAIDMIRINPPLPIEKGTYPIFLEQRTEKRVGNFTVTGKFDLVENGRVKDIKTTKVYAWVNGSNDEKYIWQGSIYRWLNPDIIWDDFIDVEMVLTDWSSLKAQTDRTYPPRNVMTKTLRLKSLEETEDFVHAKLREIEMYIGKPESEIPPCTEEEVWQRPTKYAYYANPTNKRASNVFDELYEAQNKMASNEGKGRIEKRPGEVKFCRFCPARPMCHQAEVYQTQGLLEI
jgi:hypothetical protein